MRIDERLEKIKMALCPGTCLVDNKDFRWLVSIAEAAKDVASYHFDGLSDSQLKDMQKLRIAVQVLDGL